MEQKRPEESTSKPAEMIMPYSEYVNIRHPLPYIFEVSKDGKKITYFGAHHSNDPQDKMFEDIERMIKEARPDLIFIEGRTQLGENKTRVQEHLAKMGQEKTITEGGEPDFTIKLATEMGIEVECAEPNPQDEINHLLTSGFDKDTIFAYYVTRSMNGYRRFKERTSMTDFMERAIQKFKSETQWEGFDYSPAHLETVQEDIWGQKIDYLSDFSYRFWPVPFGEAKENWSISNMLSQKSSRYRDETIVNNIEAASKTHDSIFVVYGASHAVMEESAIRAIIERA